MLAAIYELVRRKKSMRAVFAVAMDQHARSQCTNGYIWHRCRYAQPLAVAVSSTEFFSPLFSAFVLFVFFNLLWPNSIYLFVQIFGIHFHLLHIVQVFKINLNVFSPILLPSWFQKKLVLLIKIPMHARLNTFEKKNPIFQL